MNNQSRKKPFSLLTLGIALSVICLFFSQCNVITKIGNVNLAPIYDLENQSVRPNYTVFQYKQDSSQLFFSVDTRQLLYKTIDNTTNKTADFEINFHLFEEINSRTLIDSATIYLTDTIMGDPSGSISGAFRFFSPEPENKLLQITFTDNHRNYSVERLYLLSEHTITGHKSFILKTRDDKMLFSNHLIADQPFYITSAFSVHPGMWVKYFGREYPVALPPFAVASPTAYPFKSDDMFFVPFTGKESDLLQFSKPGIYHFQMDTNSNKGFTIYIHSYSYPAISHADQMIEPLRYITTGKEYKDIASTSDPKTTVDSFWIAAAGSEERAKELIRDYYTRVENANILFSSYTEGWKTDRGMIYIIFGSPNIVYRNETSEIWTYGEAGSMLSTNMIFYKVNNPFSDNDYVLERTTAYKTGWYQRVKRWRR